MNEVIISKHGNTIVGSLAHKLKLYKTSELNKILNKRLGSIDSNCNFLVVDQEGILRAAQSTKDSALKYMNETRILITIQE